MMDSPARLGLPEREPRPLELVDGAYPLGELMSGLTRGDVEDALATMARLEVALVGETIIDEYVFCDVLGKSGKDPVLSVRQRRCERQLGGVLAIANHLGAFAKEVRVAMSLPARGIAALAPTIEDLGGGHYVASGAPFNLAGTWTVKVTVRTSEFDEETAEIKVPIG